MTRVKLEDGRVINFQGNPTQSDIEEAVASLDVQEQKPAGKTGLEGISTGIAKGEAETVFGLGKLGAKIGRTLLPKALEPKEPTFFEREKPSVLEPKTTAEKVGKFGERVAEFAVPATKIQNVMKGANFFTRLFTRAGTAGTVATAQEGEIGKEAGIAAGVEVGLPVAGVVAKPVVNIVKRLFKGFGSGLSGVSTDVIDQIVDNPAQAMEISRKLTQRGNAEVLEKNARTIVEGISKVRQDARKAYGKGLEVLKKEDIKPDIFRQSIQPTLEKFGSIVEGGERTLKNIEFTDPKNIKKASALIDELSKSKLDGVAVRKLLKKVEDAKFKIATTDERLSYNAFINDLSNSLRTAVNESTDVLKTINKEFSEDMQLVDAIQGIFGKIKFRSLDDVVNASEKLESFFNQKGLRPEVIDKFLTKIGVSPAEFKTTEAVRQISQKVPGANAVGLSVGELIQGVTGSVITPNAVKNISIATGISQDALKPILERLSPTARGALIESLLGRE